MSYSKQGFHSGQTLLAEHLISMEDGIISAVSFDAQELDETQKAQARRNIGITTDDTLTLEDVAADAKAVGIKFVGERNYTNNKITELVDNAPENSNTLGKLASLAQKNTNELNTKINNINLESLGITIPTENLNQIPDTITDIQGRVNNSVSYTAQTLTDDQKAQARANIGAGTSDVKSWGELEGKPVVREGGDTLTWDGDTDGREKITIMPDGKDYYRVSDTVLLETDLLNGFSIGVDFIEEVVDFPYSEGNVMAFGGVLIIGDQNVLAIPTDNCDLIVEGQVLMTFAKKGIYFQDYITSLIIPGYTGFAQEKIDPKYLPSPDWNKIENKPFEAVGGDTLTWDGDTTGKTSVNIDIDICLVKVSDAVFEMADIANGFTVKMFIEGTEQAMPYEVVEPYQYSDDLLLFGEGAVIVVQKEGASLGEDGIVFPQKGVYVYYASDAEYGYVSSLTIPGYTGFTTEKIKQDALPEALQFSEKPTGGDTLYWDGDMTGLVNVLNACFKISDATPSMADFANGCTFGIIGTLMGIPEGSYSLSAEDIVEMDDGLITTSTWAFICVHENAVGVDFGDGMMFSESGIYLTNDGAGTYCNYLTIPGYTGFPLVTPIEEKYIPDTVARKSDIDGNLIKFATCKTASSTKEKIATIQNGNPFILRDGTRITVYFTYENTATAPTLNVNDTGNIEIRGHGASLTDTQSWQSGATIDFVYYGTYWQIVGIAQDNDTKNTAGSLDNPDTKMFLIGATTQTAETQTFSNSKCYINNNQLYSNDKAVSVSGHTHSAADIATSGAFGAQVKAKSGKQAPGTSLLRNSAILSSLTNPTAEGEIYWLYE